MLSVGQKVYFGHRKTPNTVTRVIPWDGPKRADGIIATVYLQGPRGGEYRANYFEGGRCRKI